MDNFIYKREQELKDLTVNDEKSLLYKGNSEIGSEMVHIDLKITSVISNSKDVDIAYLLKTVILSFEKYQYLTEKVDDTSKE